MQRVARPRARLGDLGGRRAARPLLSRQGVCVALWVLVTIAASALGALVDSARRAARVDEAELVGRPPLEQLEQARAAIDDASPRLLLVLAAIATLAALGSAIVTDLAELSAALVALGLGLAAPGLSWARDQRQRARDLDARIAERRAAVRSGDRRLTRAGALPRRS